MPRINYVSKRFSSGSQDIIAMANQIARDYAEQGYDLTLRQLYYQFVARGYIANRQTEYKRLGSIVNDARLAGLLDWNYIVDRTRNLRSIGTWNDPAEIVEASAAQYKRNPWDHQPFYVEVWVEKDALGGVVQRAANALRVPWFSCRGYTSQSEIWGAAQRLRSQIEDGKVPVILHLGDHDPSGIDMTRDIRDRLELFITQDWYRIYAPSEMTQYVAIWGHMEQSVDREDWAPVIVNRIALNWDQVEEYEPPPNPAKLTDSRANGYIEQFGYESWELDALDPATLNALITDTIVGEYVDQDAWDRVIKQERRERRILARVVQMMHDGEIELEEE